MKKIVLTLSIGSIVAFYSIAQKKNPNVTDAAMIMNKYNPTMGLEAAKKAVNEAKGFIDLAAANPETAEDMKMHLYRGMVYFALIEVADMEANKGEVSDTAILRSYAEISKVSFKKVMSDPKKSKVRDAEEFINQRVETSFFKGIQFYNSKNFEKATTSFLEAYKTKLFLGEEFKDAYTNTTLSLNNATDSLNNIKEFDKAIQLAENVRIEMPNNIDVYITLININLQKGDSFRAEKYLNKALAIDPLNKQLYYVLGTSYIDLKQYEKAEESLRKAIEIDPNYSEAQYQLGAHLLNWGQEILNESSSLDYRNPKVQELDKKAKEILLRGASVLEKYIEKNPNKDVLKNLEIIYRLVGDTEKAAWCKKQADAIK